QGLPRRGSARPATLRGATPLFARPRPPAWLPRRGGARQPPRACARAFALRDGALSARVPRPADGLVPGPLPPPAATPLRRARAAAGSSRARAARLPDRAQGAGPRDRRPAAPDARRAARRRRSPVLLPRPDHGVDHE